MGILNEFIDSIISGRKLRTVLVTGNQKRSRMLLIEALQNIPHEFNVSDNRYIFENGSLLMIRSNSSPDHLRGHQLDVALVDEYCSNREYIINAILKPTLISTNGQIMEINNSIRDDMQSGEPLVGQTNIAVHANNSSHFNKVK